MSETTRVADVPHGIVTTAFSKFADELGDDGSRVVTQLNRDPHFRRRIAKFALAGGYAPSADQRLARAIFGKSFLGPDEVATHFGVKWTAKDRKTLKTIPFNEAALEECRDTHLLVAGYPMNLMQVHEVNTELMYFGNDPWYGKHPFSTEEQVALRWYLLRKDIVPDSTSKSWVEQTAMLAKTEETPRACELGYAMLLYRLAHGEWAGLTKKWARTSSVRSDGYRVILHAYRGQLHVNGYSDGPRSSYLGVSSGRKS